jgi:hypothetical protein
MCVDELKGGVISHFPFDSLLQALSWQCQQLDESK